MFYIIHYSNESGSKEGVIFHSDKKEGIEMIPHDCTLSGTVEIDEDEGVLPMERRLEVRY